MISPSLPEQVQLFKSVFKGRDDVFAIRWEKGNKSGYMPAHSFDPYFYRAHKAYSEVVETKTVHSPIALKVIADRQQPTLIIVHRKQLAEQWLEKIETFLGIPKYQIGKIGQGKNKSGEQITVATMQSLTKELKKPENRELVTCNFIWNHNS